MSALASRVDRLEQKNPSLADPFAHLSDQDLEEMIETINEVLVARVESGEDDASTFPPGAWEDALAFVTSRRAVRGRLSAADLAARAARFDALSAGLPDHVALLPSLPGAAP